MKEIINEFITSYLKFDFVLGCIIGLILLVAFLYVFKRRHPDEKIQTKEIVLAFVMSIYLVSILAGTLLNRTSGQEYGFEWQLFWSYLEAVRERDWRVALQIVCNVVAFVPWGFLFPFVLDYTKRIKGMLIITLGFSLLIEIIQIVFRCGLFEFDDIFHNTLGALIGYGLWKLVSKYRRKAMSNE